jgi:hypothetical protein
MSVRNLSDRFTKDRVRAEVSSIANRSSPSNDEFGAQKCHLPFHMHVHKAVKEYAEQKGIDSKKKGRPVINARYPELPF